MRLYSTSFAVLIAAFIGSACSDKQSVLEPLIFTVRPSIDSVHLYPYTVKYVDLLVYSSDYILGEPVNEIRDIGEVRITGPWYDRDSDRFPYLAIGGTVITAAPRTMAVSVNFGGRIATFPLTVSIDEFSLLNRFVTNAPNDTVVVQRGGTFLLKFTCRDPQDQPLSKYRIFQELGGFGWGIPPYNLQPRLAVEYLDRDPAVWEYLISAIPDVAPSPEDNAFRFEFQASHKFLRIPIQITY